MSESMERLQQIERLRHRLREKQREARQIEKIRESLTIKCEIDQTLDKVEDESAVKEGIKSAWMADFEKSVNSMIDDEMGNSWVDVVGDVMDEMRKRTVEAQKGVEDSEIDLRSIMALIDEDVKNLGEFCAELMQKFMSRNVMVEMEKYRRHKMSDVGDRTQQTQIEGLSEAINEDKSKIAGNETKEGPWAELSMGDFESKETKAGESGAEPNLDNNVETGDRESKDVSDENRTVENIPAENLIRFTIVDEKNRPLGVSVASDADGDGAPVASNDQGQPLDTHEGGMFTPNACTSPAPEYTDYPASEASSGQAANQSNTGEIWMQVASSLIDQNRSNEDASVDVFEIVNMFAAATDENVPSNAI